MQHLQPMFSVDNEWLFSQQRGTVCNCCRDRLLYLLHTSNKTLHIFSSWMWTKGFVFLCVLTIPIELY
ncbi:hypothetical protein XELAEV_18039749mg [Xenopus laevis]|uniref:Uncharacterized protein n=1 Tax=Xenopus laevis TaxID=8355 RepID=A0A974H885_XENLA|nr:hypothetical protein XELAEV_18039749mg [Xenopus laevis]